MVKLAKEANITMVVVTHEMGFARQVADRIIFMADGQIIEEGSPATFFNNPTNERVKNFLGKNYSLNIKYSKVQRSGIIYEKF